MKFTLNTIGWRRTLRLKKGKAQPFVLIHPAREWIISLSLTTVSAVVLFGYAGYLLSVQTQGDSVVTVEDQSVAVYRRAEGVQYIDEYKKRAVAFEELRHDRTQVFVPIVPVEVERGTTTDEVGTPSEDVPLAIEPI